MTNTETPQQAKHLLLSLNMNLIKVLLEVVKQSLLSVSLISYDNGPENKLILGQSASLITEDVVDP